MLTDGMTDEASPSRSSARSRSGGVAEPHELAGTVVFLASDHAGYISGATINISGGLLMY